VREAEHVRIERENGEDVGSVWAVFTPRELEDLFGALQYLFDEDDRDPAWHHHVGQGDSELTITISDGDRRAQ
jgi:hypothetical protein